MKEDIEIIEELIKAAKDYNQYEGNKYYKSIENLIGRNKELEEIVNRLGKLYYEANENCIKYEKDYIPKSKVREKIEKWERALNRTKEAVDVYSVGERVVAKKEDKEECEKLLKFWKEDELIKKARIEAYKELLQDKE